MFLEISHDIIPKPKALITKDLIKRANAVWNRAIRAGIVAVIESDVIQVETGMAKSTLIPLARAVRTVGLLKASINPKIGSKKGITTLAGTWDPDGERSASAGEAEGEDSFQFETGLQNDLVWFLNFTIPVWHYVAHELGLVEDTTGPWLSLDIFLDASVKSLQEALDNDKFLPNRITDLFFFEAETRA